VAEEGKKLRILRAMLRLARTASDDPKALDDSAATKAWKRGLEVLDQYYDSEGLTDAMSDLGAMAEDGGKLAIVSGHKIFMSGGSITSDGDWYPYRRDRVDEQITQYGAASVDG
jgi:hypothetical protein